MNYTEEIALESDYRIRTILKHELLLNTIRDYLRDHFLEEQSIEKLCEQFDTNEYIIKLGFRVLFGTSVNIYLQRLRLAHSRKELLNTSRTIKEIAEEAGYKNVHHFGTAFKKRYGSTPLIFRLENSAE